MGPKVGYLCTAASSRAKLWQSAEEKLPSDLLPEGHDLLGSRVDLPQQQSRYAAEVTSFCAIGRFIRFTLFSFSVVSSENVQSEQAPPTDVLSLSSNRCSIGGKETNQKRDVAQSPAPPIIPTDPPFCDDITTSTSSEVGGAEATITTDPGTDAA